jgi:CRP-like cAMP-binding protein
MIPNLPIINGGEIKTLADDSILFAEGEIGSRMYILIDGKIKISKKNKFIAYISEAGSTIGELSLLTGLSYSATCRSVGQSQVIEVQIDDGFFEKNPNFLLHIAKDLAQKLIKSNKSKLIYF